MITKHPSPLRYPGGKTSLAPLLTEVVKINDLGGGVYIEPFAGGAGAALKLLLAEQVSEIYINDLDKKIYSFWMAILNQTDDFIRLLRSTPITVWQWRKQKAILKEPGKHSRLEVGFATFYLNRCNRSGVLNGGPIGGINQDGNYKIDARFNKKELQQRIEKIALYRDRITVKNLDGIAFLNWIFSNRTVDAANSLIYMDPPYFKKASSLYDVYFRDSDHRKLADYLKQRRPFRWIVSYDDTALIKRLYKDRRHVLLMQYSAHTVRLGRELVIFSSNCQLPRNFLDARSNKSLITATNNKTKHRPTCSI